MQIKTKKYLKKKKIPKHRGGKCVGKNKCPNRCIPKFFHQNCHDIGLGLHSEFHKKLGRPIVIYNMRNCYDFSKFYTRVKNRRIFV